MLILYLSVLVAVTMLAVVLSVRVWLARRYANRNRGLFRFFDGVKVREVDPIAVMMALHSHPEFRMDLDPKRAIADGDSEAMQRMADAVYAAFRVPPFTVPRRPGLTQMEAAELLGVFLLSMDLQKKSTSKPPTSPQSMDATSNAFGSPTTAAMSAST